MLLGVILLSMPFFSKFALRLCSYLHYNFMFWSELFLLSDISLESSGILCLCIYKMNPLKMSKLVTEETNMNCSDWLNLNGSHIHKSTCITYLQILQIKVMFMHACIYIYVRHLQWQQLFLECYVYRYRWFVHFLLRHDNIHLFLYEHLFTREKSYFPRALPSWNMTISMVNKFAYYAIGMGSQSEYDLMSNTID